MSVKNVLYGLVITACSIMLSSDATVIYEHKLDNGLNIVYLPTDSNGTLCVGVLYSVGSIYDPDGKSGLSHFLEHMMFRGTKQLSAGQLKGLLDTYDMKYNANTSHENTFFFHVVKADFIDMNLSLEADRMQNLKFADDDFLKERDVVNEERKLTSESNVVNKYVYDAMFQILFLYSPYKNWIGGYTWQIEKYNKESLMAHYKKYYSPNNVTVIVVGSKYKSNEDNWNYVKSKITKYFGSIKNNSEIPPKYEGVSDPVNPGIKYVLEKSIPEIKQSSDTIIYSFDAQYVKTFKEYRTLKLLLGILFSSDVIKRIMVDEKELVYSINASLWHLKYASNTLIFVDMELKKGVERKKVEEVLFSIISEFKEKYLTNDLLKSAKKKAVDRYDLSFDSPYDVFQNLVEYIAYGYSSADIANTKEIINSITIQDIINMLDKVFKDDNITHKIYLHPTDVEPNLVKNS